jgi:uncharacterized protein
MTNGKSSTTTRVADFILRHKRLWLVIGILTTVVLAWFAAHVEFEFSIEALFLADSPYRVKLEQFRETFGADDNMLIVAHKAPDLFSSSGYKRIESITEEFERLPYFDRVMSLTSAKTFRGSSDGFSVETVLDVANPETADWASIKSDVITDPLLTGSIVSSDGTVAAFTLEIPAKFNNNDGRARIIDDVRKIVAPHEASGEFHFSGIPHLRTMFVKHMRHDMKIFLPLCTIIVNILAFWLFRAFRANIFSTTIIFLTVVWTVGLMSISGGTINIITTVLPSLLMVMGMAYVTHYLSRYIEQLEAGYGRDEAIRQTVKKMLLPIFLTSFTTGIGFVSLLVIKVDLVRQFGLYAAAGLGIAFILTITFLTGLCLSFAPFKKGRGLFNENDAFGRYLHWNDRFVKRHPWPVIVFSFLLLGTSIFFISKLQVDNKIMEESNPKSEEYQSNRFMEENLAGILPLEIVVHAPQTDGFKEPEALRALDEISAFAESLEGIDFTLSFADVVKKMNQAMNEDDPEKFSIPNTRQAVAQYLLLQEGDELGRLVNGRYDTARIAMRCKDVGSIRIMEIEKQIDAKAIALLPAGYTAEVTGSSIMVGKLMTKLIQDMVKSLFLASFVICLLLTILFKSVRLGLLAMIPNLVPIIMSMGVLGAIGINLRTSLVVVFSISLGIAVDDTIHVIVRCRDEYRKDPDYDTALTRTFLGAGRPVIFTSLLLFLGFGVLAMSSFIPTRNFGLLSAVTMVAALLGDLYLLPALLWVFKPKLK